MHGQPQLKRINSVGTATPRIGCQRVKQRSSTKHRPNGTKGNLIIKATDLKGLVRGVPDFDNNGTKTEELRGEFIFQVAQNPRTHMVAVAVRSFTYAETDFSMLFVINPAAPDEPQLVNFVLPGQKPAADGSTLPFRAVRELYYDAAGILHLTHTDDSGSSAKVLINPDLSIRGCNYSERGEGLLCGE